MALVKISALPELSVLGDDDQLAVVHLTATKKITGLHIKEYVLSNLTVAGTTLNATLPDTNIILATDLVPNVDNTISLGSPELRWQDIHIGPGSLYIQDQNDAGLNVAITVVDGVLKIDGASELQIGDLRFVENTIESATGDVDIQIGLLTSTADIVMNRNVVMGTGKTITANITGSISGNAGTVTNGVYTTDTGTVTNTMLAGSIANNKLSNSSITVGSTGIALGATSTSLAGVTNITFAAGTTAVAPVKLTAGTLLTTAEAGAIEFAGGVMYSTPNQTTRGMIESKMIYYNTAQVALVNNTTQQSIFGLTNGVAVSYATRYRFKLVFTVRVTADNVNLFFALGGTATYFRGNYHATVGKGISGTGMMPVTVVEVYSNTDAQTKNTINISQGGSGGTYFQATVEGFVDTQYSGYIKPVVALSPAPGASSFIDSKSYMEIYPVGPAASGNADTVIGNWS